jgi:hypothetical protein
MARKEAGQEADHEVGIMDDIPLTDSMKKASVTAHALMSSAVTRSAPGPRAFVSAG